jgi:hypothetical protein
MDAKKVLDSFPGNILCKSFANYKGCKWLAKVCGDILKRREWDEQGDNSLRECINIMSKLKGRGILDYSTLETVGGIFDMAEPAQKLLSETLTMWSSVSLETHWSDVSAAILLLSQIPLQAEFVVSEAIVKDLKDLVAKVNDMPGDSGTALAQPVSSLSRNTCAFRAGSFDLGSIRPSAGVLKTNFWATTIPLRQAISNTLLLWLGLNRARNFSSRF